ncbi:MAG TPA: thioredoxin domain-containing protein [Candidatus Binataceae bacterium]|nr:thioredoxin domain-containing protein [Candidatus Binataceae bacterium]
MSEKFSSQRRPNRLIHEQSPYLRQHAYNPVDWHPWGEEALRKARESNKPILLSIGYAACHWCHVMERESFEDEQTAALMNELFVPIKVDREERPDLDQIYMEAVQAMTGRGGWPLTMFLTPAGEPFFGGTYFPPQERHGLPAFTRVLQSIAQVFRQRPDDVAHNVSEIARVLRASSALEAIPARLDGELVAEAARGLASHCDQTYGGLGDAPKFPNTFVFSLFLRMFDRTKEKEWATMVEHTLSQMAGGGIYDQIGGGFHRYSVDRQWRIPHFEKMLYDNALLARLYLDAGRALARPDFLTVARDVLDYVLREMQSPQGGFYSSQDADSEGEEGRFFVWTQPQVREVLDDDSAAIAIAYYGIEAEGNFEDSNVPHRPLTLEQAAARFKLSTEAMGRRVSEIRARLFTARQARVHPARDEKILAAWNGMMIGALAEGGWALAEPRYLAAARRAAGFVMSTMWDGTRLHRSFKDGVTRFNGYLEDYAAMANALLDLYEASLERRYLEQTASLLSVVIDRFGDERGGFFFTSDDHERLVVRGKPAFDGSTPSGNSDAALALLRLHAYTGEERWWKAASDTLKLFAKPMAEQPFSFSHMLEVADFYARRATEIVLVGDPTAPSIGQWHRRLGARYLPNRALFVVDPANPDRGFLSPALIGKGQVDGRPTAYVCRDFTCSPPRTTWDELAADLS